MVHSQEHQQLALDAARDGIVLLRNEGNLLPLKKDVKSVAVIGPNADSVTNLFGDYFSQVVLQPVGTILEGINEKRRPQHASFTRKGAVSMIRTEVVLLKPSRQQSMPMSPSSSLASRQDERALTTTHLQLTGKDTTWPVWI